jgi:hypothetical protein
MKLSTWIAGVFFSALAATGFAADDQWLQYKVSENLWQSQTDVRRQPLDLTETAPAGVALPKFTGARQLFAKWPTPMAKDGFRWIALDFPAADEVSCTAYADTNGNGSLADEEGIVQSADGCGCVGPIKFTFDSPDGAVTYHMLLTHCVDQGQPGAASIVALKSMPKRHFLFATSACLYEGDVTVDGKKYKCALYDFNCNGTFDDVSADPLQADRIKITTDAAERLHAPGKYIQIGGRLYHPAPSRDGASISFASVGDVPTGRIATAANVGQVALGGENGILYFDMKDGRADVPVGKYALFRWQTDRRDKSGVEWKMSGFDFPQAVTVDVAADAPARLDCGEPAKAWIGVEKVASGGGGGGGGGGVGGGEDWRAGVCLMGRSGETVKIAMGNGSAPPAPNLRIANADKSYNETYRLEYG